jgi:LmbE family N-acetylglucosaminyl deacetylase
VPLALHVAPHPDDEALGAGGALLRLVDGGWRVVSLACSLGRPAQVLRRRGELAEACCRAGFELRETSERIGISAYDDLVLAERCLSNEIGAALRELSPRLLLGPSPHDAHHGHEVVGRAVHRALAEHPPGSRPRWWMWELWSSLPAPTLYLGVPPRVLERAEWVLAAHLGELERSDYQRALRARAQVSAVLGAERVFGWGTPGTGDEYAEVLMEILCDEHDGWPLAEPRRFTPEATLADALPRGVDIGAWLARASPRTEILAGM